MGCMSISCFPVGNILDESRIYYMVIWKVIFIKIYRKGLCRRLNDVGGYKNPSPYIHVLQGTLVVKINRYLNRSTEMIGEVISRFFYITATTMTCTSIYRARLPPRRCFTDNYNNNNNNNLLQKYVSPKPPYDDSRHSE